MFDERGKHSTFKVFEGDTKLSSDNVDYLGKVHGLCSTSDQKFFAISGDEGVAIYDENIKQKFFIRTEFESKKVLFTENDEWLIILDKEGNIRVIDWQQPQPEITLEEDSIYDAVAARDGNHFAVATLTHFSIYNSQSKERIGYFPIEGEN